MAPNHNTAYELINGYAVNLAKPTPVVLVLGCHVIHLKLSDYSVKRNTIERNTIKTMIHSVIDSAIDSMQFFIPLLTYHMVKFHISKFLDDVC